MSLFLGSVLDHQTFSRRKILAEAILKMCLILYNIKTFLPEQFPVNHIFFLRLRKLTTLYEGCKLSCKVVVSSRLRVATDRLVCSTLVAQNLNMRKTHF